MLNVNKGIVCLLYIVCVCGEYVLPHVNGGFKVSWDPSGSGDEIEL